MLVLETKHMSHFVGSIQIPGRVGFRVRVVVTHGEMVTVWLLVSAVDDD
jgi:hypothetical protein